MVALFLISYRQKKRDKYLDYKGQKQFCPFFISHKTVDLLLNQMCPGPWMEAGFANLALVGSNPTQGTTFLITVPGTARNK